MIWTEAFRPQNLDEVVGQERVVKFFRNIGNTDVSKWPHFIFHGPPGVGKTTMGWAIANHYDLDTLRKQLLSSEMPVHIEVSKNSKGYNYSVSYHGKNPEECLDTVLRLIDILKDRFEK